MMTKEKAVLIRAIIDELIMFIEYEFNCFVLPQHMIKALEESDIIQLKAFLTLIEDGNCQEVYYWLQ